MTEMALQVPNAAWAPNCYQRFMNLMCRYASYRGRLPWT